MIDLQKILTDTHAREDELMRRNGELDKQIKMCVHEKKNIAIAVQN